jgi:hypothetical protein
MLISRRILLKRASGAASVVALTSRGFSKPTSADAPTGPLELVQTPATSGARVVASYWIRGNVYLAVPQLAEDISGGPVGMNFGDSDTDLILYRYQDGRFAEHQRVKVSGGEDAEFFEIEGRIFLATASIRTGSNPYDYATQSTIFEWIDGRLTPFQSIPTQAAKQWRYLCIGERHFLAVAQGASTEALGPDNPGNSQILEWVNGTFRHFQNVKSAWGYGWLPFRIGSDQYLAYADHTLPSTILIWDGGGFKPHQTLAGLGGRAFCFYESGDDVFLVFAKLTNETVVYRWSQGEFVAPQRISGPGGRALGMITKENQRYLILVKFITGTREAPQTIQSSEIFRVEGEAFTNIGTFPTSGGTDVSVFKVGGDMLVAISESLSADVHFKAPSHIYRFIGK